MFFDNIKIQPKPLCNKCKLHTKCKSPKIDVQGRGKLGILVIGDSPGKEADKTGISFSEEDGQLFTRELRKHNINLDRDCYRINAVRCRPTKINKKGKVIAREPNKKEIQFCQASIKSAIEELKPKFIWLLGNPALQSFYHKRLSDLSIGKFRGMCIPDKDYDAWVLPSFHPSYILKYKRDRNLKSCFQRDIKYLVDNLDRKPPEFRNPFNHIKILTDFDKTIQLLRRVLKEKPLTAFDYEGTGLKPHVKGHKIVSASICFDDISYSFPLQHPHWNKEQQIKIIRLFKKYLKDRRIKKIAHHKSFEYMWGKVIFKTTTKGMIWCTQLASHVLDTRTGLTGLKLQLFLNFGIKDYDKSIKKYIESPKKGGNCFNNILKAPLIKLLKYGAIDSLGTMWLYLKQKPQFRGKLKSANKFFQDGDNVFALMQCNGIPADKEYYQNASDDPNIGGKIVTLKKELSKTKEAKVFKKKYGKKLDIGSSHDLRKLLFDTLKLQHISETETGLKAVDKNTLEKLNTTFTNLLLKYRKFDKIEDYTNQFLREIIDNRIHSFWSLCFARSLRSSVGMVSFQNIPKRDKEAKFITRSGIIPSTGNRLLDGDFKGVEVCTSACYNKDPNLIAYINDKSTDMHRDNAQDIWMLPTSEVTDDIRHGAKNCWTFPQFYGDWYGSCADALWVEYLREKTVSGLPLEAHMRDQGIISLDEFKEHCKTVEDKMWNVRFKVYTKWKKEINKFYIDNGYVETFLGFIFKGYLDWKQVVNYLIQGTAFHINLWCLIELVKIAYQEGWLSRLLAQVHDSMLWDVVPEEFSHVVKTIKYVTEVKVREEFEWINVPMGIDMEATEIDQSWVYTKKMDLTCYNS